MKMADYNFGAGPSVVPQEVLEVIKREIMNFNHTGLSILETSHRSLDFQALISEAKNDLRALMGIPADYEILFLQGGASTQFMMLPLNLAQNKTAYYAISGIFGKKAYEEAVKASQLENIDVVSLGSTAHHHYDRLLKIDLEKIDFQKAAYLHLTTNNTVEGTAIFPENLPESHEVPLIADMSSNIMAVDYDISKFGMVYAGAQKNLGIAGLTVVIIKKDLLSKDQVLPSMLDYQVLAEHQSMYNTPPTFAIYVAGLIFKWVKAQGGVKELERQNRKKAKLLYDYIDQSDFYDNPVYNINERSICNVIFRCPYQNLDVEFANEAEKRGLRALKGHRSVGGLRASLYNAFPIEGVRKLIEFMKDFEEENK